MPAYWLEALVVLLGLLLLMMEAFGTSPSKELIRRVSIGGLVLILLPFYFAEAPPADNAEPSPSYVYDQPAIFFKLLALVTTILVLFMAYDFRKVLNRFTEDPDSEQGTGEYYALPVFACAGMMWMASARDLVSIFVSLELVTITFYILVAFMRRQVGSLEAGVKYLILGALSTGFLVYGMAWIYGVTGTTDLASIGAILSGTVDSPLTSIIAANPTPLLFGLALMLLALAFKVGAVPMHLWIPDVYTVVREHLAKQKDDQLLSQRDVSMPPPGKKNVLPRIDDRKTKRTAVIALPAAPARAVALGLDVNQERRVVADGHL
ncbi:MAG: proton-conducting transporter membrane subunit, partial [Akkermansiaceae bacterium]